MKKVSICSWMVAICLLVSGIPAFAAGIDDVYAVLGGEPAQSDSVLVEITAPVAGSVVYAGHPLTVEATVDAPESVERVEFYKDEESAPFATDTSAPYAGVLTCGADAFAVTAKAYTQSGLYNVSDAVQVAVDAAAGDVQRTYLDENFDGETVSPTIDLQGKGETAEIIPAPEEAGGGQRTGNVAHIGVSNAAAGAPWAAYVDRTTPLSGTVVIEASIMSEAAPWPGKKCQWFQFFDANGAEVSTLMEFNGSTINSFYTSDSSATTRNSVVKELQAKKWYEFKFVIDLDSRTYTVDVDGENKGGTLGLPDQTRDSWSNVTEIRNRIGEAGHGMYIDNWKIYSQPKAAKDNTIIDANFDDSTTAPAGFNLNATGAGGTAAIVPSPEDYQQQAKEGNSIVIATSDTARAPYADYDISSPATGVIVMEANIMPVSASYPKQVELFYLVSETGNIARLAKIENEDINYWNGKSRVARAIQGFTPGKWYHMKCTVDMAGTYDLEIDGASIVKNVAIVPESGAASLGGLTKVRFRIAANPEEDETSVYVDDWKIYTLPGPEIKGAVFASESGVLSIDREYAPADLRSVTVDFSEEMDADSFGDVTLMTQDGDPVAFTGEYRAQTQQYVASITGQLEEKTDYVLSFPTSVKSVAGMGITSAGTVEFATRATDFAITGIQFFGADGQTLNKAATGGSVRAEVRAENNTGETKTLCIILALYEDGRLKTCVVNSAPSVAGGQDGTFDVTLQGVAEDLTGCDVRAFVWSDLNNIWPLCSPVDAQ